MFKRIQEAFELKLWVTLIYNYFNLAIILYYLIIFKPIYSHTFCEKCAH